MSDQTEKDTVDAVGSQDETDAKGVRMPAASVPVPSAVPLVPKQTQAEFLSATYKMDYPERGVAVIINNRDFERHTNMGSRKGTDTDATNIYTKLKVLDFEVHKHDNCTKSEMRQLMKGFAKQDHSNRDCFVCVILSHGEEGTVYGTDGSIEIKELVDPYKGHRCTSLAGKPKLFFIQACRGQGLDEGTTVTDAFGAKSDSPMEVEEPVTYRIPTEADFLMAYSVVPGYFSWRNSEKGSWFIQALCQVLEKYGRTLDLMTMMTRVNKLVAYEFESNATKEFMNRKKQIPCITSMLTKDVYFLPKEL